MAINQQGPLINEQWLRQGSPTGSFVETLPRLNAGTDNAIAATGVEHCTAVVLQAGDVVTNITFLTGGTAADTPTHQYVCLRTGAGVLIAQSADKTSTARAANTAYTIALSTPYTVTAAAVFYVGIAFTATACPTLRGATLGNAAVGDNVGTLGFKVWAQTHGSAVGATAPATIATPTVVATPCWFALT